MSTWVAIGHRSWRRTSTERQITLRFAGWGLRHGGLWGASAGVIAATMPALGANPGIPGWQLILGTAAAGVVTGPALGLLTGLTCLLGDLVPKRFLDAPDYLAAVAMLVAGCWLCWPQLTATDTVSRVLAACALAAPAVVDAARSAVDLLGDQKAARHAS